MAITRLGRWSIESAAGTSASSGQSRSVLAAFVLALCFVMFVGPTASAVPSITDNIVVGAGADGLVLSADGKTLYVANDSAGTVSVIDTASKVVTTTITVGAGAIGTARYGSKVYVSCVFSSEVYVIETTTNTVSKTISVPGQPFAMAVLGTKIYVVNQSMNSVRIIDATTDTLTETEVKVGWTPAGIAIAGTKAYVPNVNTSEVSVIDTTTDSLVKSIPLSGGPRAIAASPDGKAVYVATQWTSVLAVIDTARDEITATIPDLGNGPLGVAAAGSRIYSANFYGGSVSIVDAISKTVIGTISGVGSYPGAIAISGNTLYVANYGYFAPGSVAVIEDHDLASTQVLSGFFAPVPAGGLTIVKRGSVVPLKFTVLESGKGVTDVASIDARFALSPIDCATKSATEGTAVFVGSGKLRYDSIKAQFVQNWQSPTTPGCYEVSLTITGGSRLSAQFKVK